MESSAFDEENAVLDPPRGMSTKECDTISIWRGELENGIPVVVSCWKVTKEELEEIHRTGRVWLFVMGRSMPPVSLFTAHPFKEPDT